MKVLIQDGEKFFVKDDTKDYHTKFGYIKAKDLKKAGIEVETNLGKKFAVIQPSFVDFYEKIKRGPQIIPLKDIGSIIAETGINKTSKVVDAGTGSGALALMLAYLAKEVTSYEIREDFYRIALSNKEFIGLKNLKLKNKDVYLGIEEKNVDVVTLDLPEPWKAIAPAQEALKVGGFLVSYSPTIPQVMDFVSALKQNPAFVCLKTIEILEREWEADERKVRPMSQQIGHSGFLTFVRRI
ncbi:MAG TPA: rRNA adenine N-6-methyltransferase family protein [Candidatus Nanoarchaeia archaeon]|nr:rRNA adenine N-6-methyltransferase family protein [Candidatus Nanoarchaeia archaeon]